MTLAPTVRWGTIDAMPGKEPSDLDLGPDERDLDLLDGTWEEQYYTGRLRRRDWTSIWVGLGLLAVLSLILPLLLVLIR